LPGEQRRTELLDGHELKNDQDALGVDFTDRSDLGKMKDEHTGCSVIIQHQNVGKREESQTMFGRFLSFNIVSTSMDADVQSFHPFLKDGFKLITRDPIEDLHDTIQKLLFFSNTDTINVILSLPKR
jgi:hypothetical protein